MAGFVKRICVIDLWDGDIRILTDKPHGVGFSQASVLSGFNDSLTIY